MCYKLFISFADKVNFVLFGGAAVVVNDGGNVQSCYYTNCNDSKISNLSRNKRKKQ